MTQFFLLNRVGIALCVATHENNLTRILTSNIVLGSLPLVSGPWVEKYALRFTVLQHTTTEGITTYMRLVSQSKRAAWFAVYDVKLRYCIVPHFLSIQ